MPVVFVERTTKVSSQGETTYGLWMGDPERPQSDGLWLRTCCGLDASVAKRSVTETWICLRDTKIALGCIVTW